MILYVSCHTLKEIRFKYTDRDLKYTKLKSHLQSASVILLYWTYIYLRLLWFLSTYGFLTVQKHSQCYEDLTPVLAHTLFSHPAFKLCVCEAPGLRPPLLTFTDLFTDFRGQQISSKRPKASPYTSGKILIDSLTGRATTGSLRGTNTG